MTKSDPDQRSPQETARFGDSSIKRMLSTPPKNKR
jgi:hypothetical protein